jgi:hypothetical protein
MLKKFEILVESILKESMKSSFTKDLLDADRESNYNSHLNL